MAKKIRITRKQLKEDEVRSFWNYALYWIHENQRIILIGVGCIAALFLVYSIFSRRGERNLTEANLLLSAAQTEMQNALLTPENEERQRLFTSAEDKLQTLLELYGKSRLADEAIYQLGNLAFYRNDYTMAEDYFQRFLDDAKTPLEKAQGYIALGYAYENMFFWNQDTADRTLLDRAEEAYRNAEELTSGTMESYVAMLGRARLYDLQPTEQNIRRAKDLYARVARERKLEPPRFDVASAEDYRQMIIARTEEMKRLFSLAETAQTRLDRLEAN